MARLKRPQFGRRTHGARRCSPDLESLEDRQLLAVFTPQANAADGSPKSLRAAIIQANSNGQDNTIELQAGVYQLTIANTIGQDNGAAQGDLDLTGAGHTITIQGAGSNRTRIDGGSIDRIFKIYPGVTAIIRDLTIARGLALDPGPSGAVPLTETAAGGGIFNSGTTELDRVQIENCAAVGGNGASGTAGSPAGAAGDDAYGGGIYNRGTLTLNQCSLTVNSASGGTGGTGGTSTDPSGAGGAGGSAYAGGIFSIGSLTISQSTIGANQATGGPGGAGGVDTASIGPSGGQGGNGDGGGIYVGPTASLTTMVDSTIAENNGFGGAGGDGGTGGNEGDPLMLPGDSGGNGGGGGSAEGGGIFAETSISLYNSTIAENSVYGSNGGPGGLGGNGVTQGAQGQLGYTGPAFNGGIFAPSSAPGAPGLVTSVSTIIALNTSAILLGTFPDEPDDISATFARASDTLLGDGDGAIGIVNGLGGNIVGADPKLGFLDDNGGPTQTMALLPGSPAIDAGSNPLGLTSDQRGYSPRTIDGYTDIGAYELGANAPSGAAAGIIAKVKKIKGRREILVYDSATNVLKFTIHPFGKSYRGNFQVTTADVDNDGVGDVLASYRRGRKLITWAYSGIDGTLLSVNRTTP